MNDKYIARMAEMFFDGEHIGEVLIDEMDMTADTTSETWNKAGAILRGFGRLPTEIQKVIIAAGSVDDDDVGAGLFIQALQDWLTRGALQILDQINKGLAGESEDGNGL